MSLFGKTFCLSVLILTSMATFNTGEVSAQNYPSMNEDDLNLTRGVAWAAKAFRYNEVSNVVDGLTDRILGRIAPDRHGVGGGLIFTALDAPRPGSSVFISLWGVTLTGDRPPGCYVEYFVQLAPTNTNIDLDSLVPKSLEVRVGSRVIEIEPFRDATKTRRAFNYAYEVYDYQTQRNYVYNSVWYMTRNLFKLTSSDVRTLMSAPEGEVRTRLTFSDSSRIIVPIGGGTVAKWKEAYALDPSCGESKTSEEPIVPKKMAANTGDRIKPTDPASSNSVSDPSNVNGRPQGKVALAARQSIDSVTARLDGAYVTSSGTYESKLLIDNKSDRDFAFVPIFAKVVDSKGKDVSARVIIDTDSSGITQPGETTRGRMVILGRKWNASGKQGLFLVIQGNGDRNFRIPF